MWCYFYSRIVKITSQNTILVTFSENNPPKVEERNLLNITIRKCERCAFCLSDKAVDDTMTRIVKRMEL